MLLATRDLPLYHDLPSERLVSTFVQGLDTHRRICWELRVHLDTPGGTRTVSTPIDVIPLRAPERPGDVAPDALSETSGGSG